MTRKQFCILVLIIIFGVLIRVYLVGFLPIWFDEYRTLEVLQHSFTEISSGILDPGHPPGYYLVLKVLSLFSTNIYYLRSSTLVFFVINTTLLYKFAKKCIDIRFGIVAVLLYALSGYFVLFDWQIRSYTGLLTLILLSLNLFYGKQTKLRLFFFTVLNSFGIFFDYGYSFYLIPLVLIETVKAFVNKKYSYRIISLIISCIVFLVVWENTFRSQFQAGLDSIKWISFATLPSFFLPFFIGTHKNIVNTFAIVGVLIWGMYAILRFRLKIHLALISIVAVSLCTAIIFGYVSGPILHVRSMQIVGLTVLMIQSVTTYYLLDKDKSMAAILISLIVINVVGILIRLPISPAEFLISFSLP